MCTTPDSSWLRFESSSTCTWEPPTRSARSHWSQGKKRERQRENKSECTKINMRSLTGPTEWPNLHLSEKSVGNGSPGHW